jgi:outer membrane protein OmpA-like peptidoglycan-associated protein
MLLALAAAISFTQIACPGGTTVPTGQVCPTADAFLLFFDWDSSEINPATAATLDNGVGLFPRFEGYRIAMSSHTDRSGTEAYNMRLSRRRAERVRDYLVARGIPAASIRFQAYGESLPIVETEDGVREPQNRHIQLLLVPPGE